MMVDCGSCTGDKEDFRPYMEDLKEYISGGIDLLVITHEHNDHVNGFAKWPEIFRELQIGKAWFAWTENPRDPQGRAQELLKKRERLKMAINCALREIRSRAYDVKDDYYLQQILQAQKGFIQGMETLAEINLGESDHEHEPLPGMLMIRKILKDKNVPVEYLNPGQTIALPNLPGLKIYVLGPPYEKEAIYRNGKEGTDVYKKRLFLHDMALSTNAFINLKEKEYEEKDLPFGPQYVVNDNNRSLISSLCKEEGVESNENSIYYLYHDSKQAWRKIDSEWLYSGGSLALRLNSHINNTSLVLAVESEATGRVLLLPGDAEFGSWESWHLIEKWKGKGKNGKHLVEDLLSRVAFYKISHHLSYNGTALKVGVEMMSSDDLICMATLDRSRISSRWKSTMPNNKLMQALIDKCQGRVFIMDEFEIPEGPSKILDPETLPESKYHVGRLPDNRIIYKQCVVDL
jgi:hypothetical protein